MTILKFGCQVCGEPHTVVRGIRRYRLCGECDKRIGEQITSLTKDSPRQHVFNLDSMYYFLIECGNYDSAQCMVQPAQRVEAREDQQYIMDVEEYTEWCNKLQGGDR